MKDVDKGMEWLQLDPNHERNRAALLDPWLAGHDCQSRSFPSRIIVWLSQYGVAVQGGVAPDRKVLAQIAKLLLEEGHLCMSERNGLLADMKRWRDEDSRVQKELVCGYFSAGGQRLMASSALSSLMLAASTVGMNAGLSAAAFHESMSLYGILDEKARAGIKPSLMSYVFGHPRGRLILDPPALGKDGAPLSVLVPEAPAHKGSVKKLCSLVNSLGWARGAANLSRALSQDEKDFASGAREFIAMLSSELDKPRAYSQENSVFKVGPSNAALSPPSAQTLREQFVGANMLDDLKAVESKCDHVEAGSLEAKRARNRFQKPKPPKRVRDRMYFNGREKL